MIYFHEDLHRQIELIPKENYFFTNKHINELPSSGANSYGYENCVQRKKEPIKIAGKKIPFDEVNSMLKPGSSFYTDEIDSGYGTIFYPVKNIVCWGFEFYGIFVEFDERKLVTSIWLFRSARDFKNDDSGKELFEKLILLGSAYELILVDWAKEVTVRIASPENCRDYLIHELRFDVAEIQKT